MCFFLLLQILLTFTMFKLEDANGIGVCWDSVEVYDGADTLAPILGTFCGHTIPEQIHSSGHVLTVVFRSDDSITGEGFTAVATRELPGNGPEAINHAGMKENLYYLNALGNIYMVNFLFSSGFCMYCALILFRHNI